MYNTKRSDYNNEYLHTIYRFLVDSVQEKRSPYQSHYVHKWHIVDIELYKYVANNSLIKINVDEKMCIRKILLFAS